MSKRIYVKEYIEISSEAFDNLIDFLISREIDIAQDEEDLGELKLLFTEIFGESPQEREQ